MREQVTRATQLTGCRCAARRLFRRRIDVSSLLLCSLRLIHSISGKCVALVGYLVAQFAEHCAVAVDLAMKNQSQLSRTGSDTYLIICPKTPR